MSEPTVIITRSHVRDADLSRLDRDAPILTAQERRWGRRRVTTEKGREPLALALPTGSALVPGEILHVARDWYVMIETPTSPYSWSRPDRPHRQGHRPLGAPPPSRRSAGDDTLNLSLSAPRDIAPPSDR